MSNVVDFPKKKETAEEVTLPERVPCPSCYAEPGQACLTNSPDGGIVQSVRGERLRKRATYPHVARIRLSLAVDRMGGIERCAELMVKALKIPDGFIRGLRRAR